MCKSAAQGGQRCAAHTGSRFAALKPADGQAFDQAAAEYASTSAGAESLQADAAEARARSDYEHEARLNAAIARGQALRSANKEAATLLIALSTCADAIATNDDEAVYNDRQKTDDESFARWQETYGDTTPENACRTDGCDGPVDEDEPTGYCRFCLEDQAEAARRPSAD